MDFETWSRVGPGQLNNGWRARDCTEFDCGFLSAIQVDFQFCGIVTLHRRIICRRELKRNRCSRGQGDLIHRASIENQIESAVDFDNDWNVEFRRILQVDAILAVFFPSIHPGAVVDFYRRLDGQSDNINSAYLLLMIDACRMLLTSIMIMILVLSSW